MEPAYQRFRSFPTMNRRDFLYAGSGNRSGHQARSYARILGANDSVGLGVSASAAAAQSWADAFLDDERARIVAVCDIYDAQETPSFPGLPKDHAAS